MKGVLNLKFRGRLFATLTVLMVVGAIATNVIVFEAKERKHQEWLDYKAEEYSEVIEELSTKESLDHKDKFSLKLEEGWEITYQDVANDEEVLGARTYRYFLKDKEDYHFSIFKEVEYTDTTAPTITKGNDVSLFVGDTFDKNNLGISAKDDLDEEIELSLDSNVDTKKAGAYSVKITATDKSGNTSTDEVKVLIKVKPAPPVQKPVSQQKGGGKSSYQPAQGIDFTLNALANQTIYFHSSGRKVPYQNRGAASGQSFIDNNKWSATTWDFGQDLVNYGMRTTHSNNDGRPTYMAAHASHGFSVAMYMKAGEKVSIKDHTGSVKTYTVQNRYQYDTRIASSADHHFGQLETFANSEVVVLQTCLDTTNKLNAITILR